MGKKGRKTRWRSFEIGDEEENVQPSHGTSSSIPPSTVQIKNEWRNDKDHHYHHQHAQHLVHHQSQHNNVPQRFHESTAQKSYKYPNHNTTTNSWFRGQSSTHNSAAGADYKSGKKLSFDVKKESRNYNTKFRDYNGGSTLNEVKPKPTFNEDEYTKISTPRQDVLFKKGYLSRPKPKASVESSDNTSSIATTVDDPLLLNLDSGNSSTISSLPSISPDISQYANNSNLDYNLSQFTGFYDETGAFIPNPLLMNGYNFYNGQQIFMIPYNNAAHCQNYNYNMDYNNYNNTNSFDEKIHNPEQPEDVEEGEEIEVVTVPNEIIESEENVDSPDASVKLIDANEVIESTENVLPNVNYMGVDAPPPPYLIYGYYVNQLPPLIAPIISNSVPAPESVELTESKDNKQKQFLQKKRKRKIRSTLNISNNNSTSDYSGDESASSDEVTLMPVNEVEPKMNISTSQLNVEVKEFKPRWALNDNVASEQKEPISTHTIKTSERITDTTVRDAPVDKKKHSPKVDPWILIGAKGKQKSLSVSPNTETKLPSMNDIQMNDVSKTSTGNSIDKNKKPVINIKTKTKKLKKKGKYKYNANGSIASMQQNGFEIIEPDFMNKSTTDSTDSLPECDNDVIQQIITKTTEEVTETDPDKITLPSIEPLMEAAADEEEILEEINEPVVEDVIKHQWMNLSNEHITSEEVTNKVEDDNVDEEIFANISDLPIEECDNNEVIRVCVEENEDVKPDVVLEPISIRITDQVLQWLGDKKKENITNPLFIVPQNPIIVEKFQLFKRNLLRDLEYMHAMKHHSEYSEGDDEEDDGSNDEGDNAYEYYDENEDELEFNRKTRVNSNTTDTDSDYMSDIQIKNNNCKDASITSSLASPITSPKTTPLIDDGTDDKSLLINGKDLVNGNCNGSNSSSNSKINKNNERIQNSTSSNSSNTTNAAAVAKSSRNKLGCPIM